MVKQAAAAAAAAEAEAAAAPVARMHCSPNIDDGLQLPHVTSTCCIVVSDVLASGGGTPGNTVPEGRHVIESSDSRVACCG
jgi:hypothetical protein